MSLPNLRFNKHLTKKLIKSSPKERINSQTVKWHLENSNQNFGSFVNGPLSTVLFIIQQVEEDRYRLVVAKSNGFCGIYLIDNIDLYLDYIGAEKLEMIDEEEAAKVLEATKILPSSGIIYIDEKKIFVYDHTNY